MEARQLQSARWSALTGHRRAGIVAGALIALSALAFLLANGAGLSDPGLQYDELLFVNAALGNTHAYHGFIYSESLGVPTMLMPYIGALKAWVYTPIFSIFGVSVYSVRVPALLLAALALIGAVGLIQRLLGTWPAVVLALLLASDPVFGAVSRADWGPIVLSALFRMAALLAYFGYLRRRSVRYLWLLVILLAVGLFNKLDYGWFIVALVVSAVVVHHRELLEPARRRVSALVALGAFGAVMIAAFVTLVVPAMKLPSPDPAVSLGTRIDEVKTLFLTTVNGTGVYQYMTGSFLGHPTLIGWLMPWILLGAVAVGAWSLTLGRRREAGDPLREAASTTTFFLVLFVVTIIGIVVTRQATGPQHIMLLWPIPAALAVCLLTTAARIPVLALGRSLAALVAIALALLLFTQVRTTSAYVHAYRRDRQWSSIWSPEIYSAARAVARAAPGVRSIVTADWGLGTQTFALGTNAVRERFSDDWPSFTGPTATPTALEQEFLQNRPVIIMYHTRSAQIMPLTTQRVQEILKSFGSRVHPIFVGRQIEADIIER